MAILEVTENKKQYLPLLLLGDEQEDMIDRYLERGRLFVMQFEEPSAVCVVTNEGDGVLEIKNLVVHPDFRRQGIGRTMIDEVANRACGVCHTLQVGTGDSPATMPFYERCGFVRHHTIKNFFTNNYDHPIIEDGVQLVDMVVLRRNL